MFLYSSKVKTLTSQKTVLTACRVDTTYDNLTTQEIIRAQCSGAFCSNFKKLSKGSGNWSQKFLKHLHHPNPAPLHQV